MPLMNRFQWLLLFTIQKKLDLFGSASDGARGNHAALCSSMRSLQHLK